MGSLVGVCSTYVTVDAWAHIITASSAAKVDKKREGQHVAASQFPMGQEGGAEGSRERVAGLRRNIIKVANTVFRGGCDGVVVSWFTTPKGSYFLLC